MLINCSIALNTLTKFRCEEREGRKQPEETQLSSGWGTPWWPTDTLPASGMFVHQKYARKVHYAKGQCIQAERTDAKTRCFRETKGCFWTSLEDYLEFSSPGICTNIYKKIWQSFLYSSSFCSPHLLGKFIYLNDLDLPSFPTFYLSL